MTAGFWKTDPLGRDRMRIFFTCIPKIFCATSLMLGPNVMSLRRSRFTLTNQRPKMRSSTCWFESQIFCDNKIRDVSSVSNPKRPPYHASSAGALNRWIVIRKRATQWARIKTAAMTATPSPRPTNPSCSVVDAFTEMRSRGVSSTSAIH